MATFGPGTPQLGPKHHLLCVSFGSHSNGSLCLHCVKRLMSYHNNHCFQRFVQSVATRKAKISGLKRFNVWKEVDDREEEAEPFLNEQKPPVHNFVRYCETLLGDN